MGSFDLNHHLATSQNTIATAQQHKNSSMLKGYFTQKIKNYLIISSSLWQSKTVCLSLFGGMKIFWKLLFTKQFWWPLSSIVCTKQTNKQKKTHWDILLCSTEEISQIVLQLTWGWVNDDRKTIPLRSTYSLLFTPCRLRKNF